MSSLMHAFVCDENGFIVSAELVLVATIAILAMIVGLTEVAYGVNEELEDVGAAFGALNQSYTFRGVGGHKGSLAGSVHIDHRDYCDSECDIVCTVYPTGEDHRNPHGGHHGW